MKKISLILGSLLIAGTTLSKEIVAAPAVGQEEQNKITGVAVVEPQAVDGIDIPKFKPKGYISLENQYRGKSEHGGAEKKKIAKASKNGKYSGAAQEHIFMELLGSVAITPKDTFAFRARNRVSIINEADSRETSNENSKDYRLRWDHSFGKVAGSKVLFNTRVEGRLNTNHDSYTFYTKFQFKNYFSNSKFYKIDSLAIVPKFRYTDFDYGLEEYSTGVGADFNHSGSMELGAFGTLETAVNVLYLYSETNSKRFRQQKVYGGANKTTKKVYTSNGNTTALEAYLYHTLPLWSSESNKYRVQFHHEGGLDPMVWDHRPNDGAGTVAYYEPMLQLVQKVNTVTSLTYSAGAYLSNYWSDGNGRTGDYQWEPRAGVVLRTKF